MRIRAALLLCVFLTAFCQLCGAQEAALPSVDGFQYTINEDDTAAITKYTITQITVPAQVEGHPVTILGERAIIYNDSLESILLPDSLREIQKFAMYYNRLLQNVEIPAGVTMIGYGALDSCTSLQAIGVAAGNEVYESVGGVLFDRQRKMLHTYPCGKADARYEVPAGTVFINDYAFCRSQLKEIILPDSATEIGFAAFRECAGLTTIALPDALTSIGGLAFKGCAGLTSLNIPKGVTWIGDDVFADCAGLTIGVYDGSYAHRYAVERSVPFNILTE